MLQASGGGIFSGFGGVLLTLTLHTTCLAEAGVVGGLAVDSS